MPKKHHRPFPKPASTSPNYFSNSTTSASAPHDRSSATPAAADNAPKSVNDLLTHLRRSQTHAQSASDSARNLSSLTRTVPLSPQNLIPDASPPPPPPNRTRVGQQRRSRVAGPPPPASWLRKETEHAASRDVDIRTECRRLEDVYTLPGMTPIKNKHLSHYALLSLAKNWSFHVAYDQHYLPELRPGLKSLLLVYVSVYSPCGVTIRSLHALFPPPAPHSQKPEEEDPWEDLQEEDTTTDVQHLPLSYALSAQLTFKDLTRLFTPPPSGTLETWDSPATPRTRFPNLTHLSLASPSSSLPPSKLWKSFLSFTRYIPTITHLSLASWPVPPHEPAETLKRLARSLICLKFLDVSDCPGNMYTDLMEVEWGRAWRGVEEVICRQREPETADRFKEWRAERRELARVLGRRIREVRADGGGKWCRVVVE